VSRRRAVSPPPASSAEWPVYAARPIPPPPVPEAAREFSFDR
jgi:hypothetical protein